MNWIKVFDDKEEVDRLFSNKKMILITVNGIKICFGKLGDYYFALEDECPHRGGSLSQGVTNYLGEVVCPLHAYRYHIKTGRECEIKTRNAKVFKLEWRENGLFMEIG